MIFFVSKGCIEKKCELWFLVFENDNEDFNGYDN